MSKDSLETKGNGRFDVVIIGDYDENEKLFSKTFPILKNNLKHKYLNRFDLYIREEIKYPKEFTIKYYPELLDKIINIDILILTYNASNKLSFEFLQKFYYMYYSKLEEKDKAKNIIIVEFDNALKDVEKNDIKIDLNDLNEIRSLFNAYFYKLKESEEKLVDILKNCVQNLTKIYNFKVEYKYFYSIDSNNDIILVFLIYGDKKLQNLFIKMLLDSNFHQEYRQLQDNFYELKYELRTRDKILNFKIKLKIMENGSCCNNSTSNILLYDINKKESYISIKSISEEYMTFNGPNFMQIFDIISFNTSSNIITYNENNLEINKAKNLADELGADFSIINVNNNMNLNEEIKMKFEKRLEQIASIINKIKNNNENEDIDINKKDAFQFDYLVFKNYDSPLLYIKDINNQIRKDFKNKDDFLMNICPFCYKYSDIRLDEFSNIILLYCKKCKNEPFGLGIEQFNKYNIQKNKYVHCENCKNILNYDFENKKLFCTCELVKKQKNKNPNSSDEIFIPCFLKDSYCYTHKKFHKYYMKYSKKGLCEDCKDKKKYKNFYIEDYNEMEINDLIKTKKIELQKELDFINSLKEKFKQCIDSLSNKFEELIQNKMKIHFIKSELINNLEVIKNNYIIISNVSSLKFDTGDVFTYNEDDSNENKIKNIFTYLNSGIDLKNLYFAKEKNKTEFIQNGLDNNLTSDIKNTLITDICTLNNNKYICVSFNDGQAKIFESKISDKNSYPLCVIKEFLPNLGVNSIYVSKKDNILKKNNYNKNEIIYLSGYEEIKIIQMSDNYDSYNLLYEIKDEYSNIHDIVEIDYNNILILNNTNLLKIANFNKREDNEINIELKDITNLLIPSGTFVISLNKISDSIISLTLTKFNIFRTQIIDNKNDINLNEELNINRMTIERFNTLDNLDIDSLNLLGKEMNMEGDTVNEINKKGKFVKIFLINNDNDKIKEENITKNSSNDIKIKKEYIFDKNFSLLGSISDDDNLLLLNYSENNNNINKIENILYIFDFNICQFINAFKFNNMWKQPKLFAKMDYENLLNRKGFIICDEELYVEQYFYDKNYVNKIFHTSRAIINLKTDKEPFKLISLNNSIFLICNNSEYCIMNF